MNENKFQCIHCGRTLFIGELNSASFTIKCKKCAAVNLIQVHPHITIQEVPPALMMKGKVMGVSLPKVKPMVRLVSTE